jgi:hypothetical protein
VRLAGADIATPDVAVRTTACGLLGVACELHDDVRREAATLLLSCAAVEADNAVLWAIVRGLGAAADARSLPVLLGLVGNDNADVRLAVAASLPAVMGDDIDDEAGVAALTRLCTDADPGVRNWATFGLGWQSSADGPVVRRTLWDRTTDSDAEVREEGIRGLARRRDRRAVPLLAGLLTEESAHVFTFDAAAFVGDPALVPALEGFDPADTGVGEALRECDPARRALRDTFALDVLERVWASRPDWVVTMFGERFELGLILGVAVPGAPSTVWSVEALLERADGDPILAARQVVADVTHGRH